VAVETIDWGRSFGLKSSDIGQENCFGADFKLREELFANLSLVLPKHDGQLIGANTLREEPGTDARGADYGIDDEQLREYREQTLGLDKQKVIILIGSGNIDATLRVFDFRVLNLG
jgi:hypothetical protein